MIGIINNITKTDAIKDAEIREKENKVAELFTLSEFNRLSTGMGYFEVVDIVGSNGTTLSENNIGGYENIMYKFDGEGIANANVMFQNGKLISKAQIGLD